MAQDILFASFSRYLYGLFLVVFPAQISGKYGLIVLAYFNVFLSCIRQTNQLLIQDMIFSRIADSYVKLICEPMDIKMKDSFFKVNNYYFGNTSNIHTVNSL